jgi:hypothetical protein
VEAPSRVPPPKERLPSIQSPVDAKAVLDLVYQEQELDLKIANKIERLEELDAELAQIKPLKKKHKID